MSKLGPWRGLALDDTQRDIARTLDNFAESRDLDLADDPDKIESVVSELAALGLWTLGSSESSGGGGAELSLVAVVLERLGRHCPALGWASVQTSVGADVLAALGQDEDLISDLHHGKSAVAIVDSRHPHVTMNLHEAAITGEVARIDAAHESPWLLILVEGDRAALIPPSSSVFTPVRRTGLAGALTRSVTFEQHGVHILDKVSADKINARLDTGIGAVAVGIAGQALDETLEYTSSRVQFGNPLTHLPTMRASLLDQFAKVTVSLSNTLNPVHEPAAAHAAASVALESAVQCAAAALQAHGGYGYLTEYPAERRLRDAISLRAASANQARAAALGKSLVGLEPTAK